LTQTLNNWFRLFLCGLQTWVSEHTTGVWDTFPWSKTYAFELLHFVIQTKLRQIEIVRLVFIINGDQKSLSKLKVCTRFGPFRTYLTLFSKESYSRLFLYIHALVHPNLITVSWSTISPVVGHIRVTVIITVTRHHGTRWRIDRQWEIAIALAVIRSHVCWCN
jgi:hypothetical protein